MIQPLRNVHRRVFLVLAVLTPAILIAGLGSRRSVTVQRTELCDPSHPPQLRNLPGAQNQYVWEPACQWVQPDILMYWTAQQQATKGLPEDAQPLGSYAPGQAFVLSPERTRGSVLLYSLPNKKVLGSSRVEGRP